MQACSPALAAGTWTSWRGWLARMGVWSMLLMGFGDGEGGHAAGVDRLGSTALDRPDKAGRTPMYMAVGCGRVSVVETLG